MKRTGTNEIAINFEGISKKYEIHHERPTLVEHLVRGRNETFWALHDISLTIRKGERVGILGVNGSGKTTLLKIIAGITSPSRGKATVNGRVVSLIDLEAGFHPELTGFQNIFLNGMILGMKKKDIERKVKEIIAFADIGKFIDVPLFTYSEGMKLRLGFAVAISVAPDILVLDEGLGVGDEQFQRKARDKIQEFFRNGKTIIIVSHWLEFLQANCTRILWLHDGHLRADGTTSVIGKYRTMSRRGLRQ